MGAAMGGGASFNVDWESICGILSIDQDSDFSNLLGHNPHHQLPTSDDNEGLLSLLMGDANDDPIITSPFAQYYTQQPLTNPNIFPQFMSCSTTSPHDLSNNSSKPYNNNNNNDDQVTKRARDQLGMSRPYHQIPVPKKKARVSKNVGKGKRKTQSRKSKFNEAFFEQVVEENEEDRKSSCDESNASEELAIRDSNGKKRASRGSATDPQSLYARRRRERINERLRILQTLVPNGTKVDISTMLEQAVNYVKFLQLQIKLLSSDEMWMYAPLAYNGFDVGHYNTIWS